VRLEKIVSQLEAKFTPEEKAEIEVQPTADPAAYELCVRAKSMIARVAYESSGLENLVEASQLLEEATSRDPAFYLAYCQLANAHDQIHFYGIDPTARRLALAEAAVQAAIKLRPDAGETHLASATHYYFGYRDYDRALKELALAQRKLPNDPLPIVLIGYIAALGDKDNAIREGQRAVQLLPSSKDAIVGPLVLQHLAVIHAWTGEKALALQELKEVITMPSYLSYGMLLRHPLWSPLRDEPSFKEIVASLAPAAP
jgi:tetratricopeptide (TPR) repeat protein